MTVPLLDELSPCMAFPSRPDCKRNSNSRTPSGEQFTQVVIELSEENERLRKALLEARTNLDQLQSRADEVGFAVIDTFTKLSVQTISFVPLFMRKGYSFYVHLLLDFYSVDSRDFCFIDPPCTLL